MYEIFWTHGHSTARNGTELNANYVILTTFNTLTDTGWGRGDGYGLAHRRGAKGRGAASSTSAVARRRA